jgi:uncharacterized protein (DUF1778 family)
MSGLSEGNEEATPREADRALADRTRYVIDHEVAQQFLAAVEQPSPGAQNGLRRLIAKPSILPEAARESAAPDDA